MAKAVFTASESTAYDDSIEQWYHFPKTYLNQVEKSIGDLVVYYEPRRTHGPNSATGRSAYFALARPTRIRPDPAREDHFYVDITDYIEFDRAIPFSEGGAYYESVLQKADGTTSKGAFGRSVRIVPEAEFDAILAAGFSVTREKWEVSDVVEEYADRPIIERVVARPFRDRAFQRHVRKAYDNRCAVTGLRLINGGGRPEVQAAHIRPVEMKGPDTVRNGIALTGTAHWLFDRGLISFEDDYRLLISPHGVPEDLDKLILPDRRLITPENSDWRPHPFYLRWHREHRFKS
jgi:putative restriction endonuclease